MIGKARRRGTFEERKAQAIAEGRSKENRREILRNVRKSAREISLVWKVRYKDVVQNILIKPKGR
jgi:hypothetical protein